MRTEIGNTGLDNRTIAAWESASVVSSAIIAEWLLVNVSGLPKLVAAIPVVLAFALIMASQIERRETLKELGLRFDNFLQAGARLLPATLVLTLVLIGFGYFARSLNFWRWGGDSLPTKLLFGFGWALVQQYALQSFLNRRLMIVLGRGWPSVLVVALLFAALHLPNPWLTVATFAAGVVWSAIFQRAPNLLAIALSHVLLTWALISTVPPAYLAHLRFGAKYFF